MAGHPWGALPSYLQRLVEPSHAVAVQLDPHLPGPRRAEPDGVPAQRAWRSWASDPRRLCRLSGQKPGREPGKLRPLNQQQSISFAMHGSAGRCRAGVGLAVTRRRCHLGGGLSVRTCRGSPGSAPGARRAGRRGHRSFRGCGTRRSSGTAVQQARHRRQLACRDC